MILISSENTYMDPTVVSNIMVKAEERRLWQTPKQKLKRKVFCLYKQGSSRHFGKQQRDAVSSSIPILPPTPLSGHQRIFSPPICTVWGLFSKSTILASITVATWLPHVQWNDFAKVTLSLMFLLTLNNIPTVIVTHSHDSWLCHS